MIQRLIATPDWADFKKIKLIYLEAWTLTIETGEKHVVDHIVPLQSPIVCGLHCEFNLRAITYDENDKKSNKHWPDQWESGQMALFSDFEGVPGILAPPEAVQGLERASGGSQQVPKTGNLVAIAT